MGASGCDAPNLAWIGATTKQASAKPRPGFAASGSPIERTHTAALTLPDPVQPHAKMALMHSRTMKLVMAAAKAWTTAVAVAVLAILLAPSFFGPAPTWSDRLLMALPGLALLAIGWVWILHIRRGIGRP
jgi:hypothetical protein